MFDTPRQNIAAALALIACAWTFWRGGKPERLAAFAVFAGWMLSAVLTDTRHWNTPQYAVFAVDAVVLAVLLWIAIRSDRFWPMWAAGLQLIGTSSHFVMLLDPRVVPRAYFAVMAMWGYFILAALVIGTYLEVERPRRRGRLQARG